MTNFKLDEISVKLRLNRWQLHGLIQSGVLGLTDESGIPSDAGVDEYLKYGTQWNINHKREAPPVDATEPEGWENSLPSTLCEQEISTTPDFSVKPAMWLAHFYLRPNYFFFAPPEEYALVGPSQVYLSEKLVIETNGKNIGIYPDPDGRLALITICVLASETSEPLLTARNLITPILNHLTTLTDHTLPIVQQLLIGLPTGNITVQRTITAKPISLRLENFTTHDPLLDAESLYKLALTCNDATYAYLSFWRAIEAVNHDFSSWIQRNNIKPVGYGPTRTPKHKIFGEWADMKFNDVINKMTATKRNGIAHGGQEGQVISGADFADIQEIKKIVPILRYIAKHKIQNFKHNLSLAVSGNATIKTKKI